MMIRSRHQPPAASQLAAGGVLLHAVALLLAMLHGGYAALLATHGRELWRLDTYDTARAVPGGITTWAVLAAVAALLLLAGTATRREALTGAGASVAAVWLGALALGFLGDYTEDHNVAALPGLLSYGCWGMLAAVRAGAVVRR